MPDVIHACPAGDEAFAPCCGRTPLELPRGDRMTLDPALVNCWTGDDPRLTSSPANEGGER